MASLKRASMLLMLLGGFMVAGCQQCKSMQAVNKYPDFTVRRSCELPGTFGPPICIVWYKPVPGTNKWQVYKTISSAEQVFQIINLLRTEVHEIFKSNNLTDFTNSKAQAEAFKGDQRLSFIYHKPRWKVITVRNMEFVISDNMFVWPAGQSEKIYKIFMEQKEWGDYQKLLDEMFYKARGYYPGTFEPESTED